MVINNRPREGECGNAGKCGRAVSRGGKADNRAGARHLLARQPGAAMVRPGAGTRRDGTAPAVFRAVLLRFGGAAIVGRDLRQKHGRNVTPSRASNNVLARARCIPAGSTSRQAATGKHYNQPRPWRQGGAIVGGAPPRCRPEMRCVSILGLAGSLAWLKTTRPHTETPGFPSAWVVDQSVVSRIGRAPWQARARWPP